VVVLARQAVIAFAGSAEHVLGLFIAHVMYAVAEIVVGLSSSAMDACYQTSDGWMSSIMLGLVGLV
jgi:hypothetical protein